MKAVVVGGGVAGPATAMALQKVGIEAVVLEARDRAATEAGSYLTIAPNGLDALAAIDCLDLVRGLGFPLAPQHHARRHRAAARVGHPGHAPGRRHHGAHDEATPPHAGPDGRGRAARHRGQVCRQGRLGAHRRRAGGRHPRRRQQRRGRPARGGVRRALSGPGRRRPGGTGREVCRADQLRRHHPQEPARAASCPADGWQFVFGRHAFVGLHRTPADDVVWFVNVPEAEISRERRATTTTDEWQAHLAALVTDDAGPARALIEAGELELAGDNTYDLRPRGAPGTGAACRPGRRRCACAVAELGSRRLARPGGRRRAGGLPRRGHRRVRGVRRLRRRPAASGWRRSSRSGRGRAARRSRAGSGGCRWRR